MEKFEFQKEENLKKWLLEEYCDPDLLEHDYKYNKLIVIKGQELEIKPSEFQKITNFLLCGKIIK